MKGRILELMRHRKALWQAWHTSETQVTVELNLRTMIQVLRGTTIIFFSCKFGNIVDPLEISLLLQVTCFYTAFAFTGHLVIRSSFYCVLFLFTGLFKVSFLESQGSPLNTLSNLYFLILDSNSVYIKRSHLLC